MEAERIRGPQNDRNGVRVLLKMDPGMELQTFSNRHLRVPEDGMIELSADDAESVIAAGWTKLAESPDYELPGYDHNYRHERNEPEGPKRVYAVGSMEWQTEKANVRAARKAKEEAREKMRLARVAAFLAKKS